MAEDLVNLNLFMDILLPNMVQTEEKLDMNATRVLLVPVFTMTCFLNFFIVEYAITLRLY